MTWLDWFKLGCGVIAFLAMMVALVCCLLAGRYEKQSREIRRQRWRG